MSRDRLFLAWNTYTSECNQARSKWPPQESPCGRFMIFSLEYEAASESAQEKRERTIRGALDKTKEAMP